MQQLHLTDRCSEVSLTNLLEHKVKHKIGFVESETSRRYVSSTPSFYTPESFRISAKDVKQGSAGEHPDSAYWLQEYTKTCIEVIKTYDSMIDAGICAEQARFILPQGVLVNWVWTGSLYAYANAYNQRSDSHAQKETQELAKQLNEIISPLYPVSWNALTKGDY